MPIMATMPTAHTTPNATHHGSIPRRARARDALISGVPLIAFLDRVVAREAVFFTRRGVDDFVVFFAPTAILLREILRRVLSA